MTFRRSEISEHDGAPIELYRFAIGDGNSAVYGYTSAEQAVEFNGVQYAPKAINREKIVVTGNLDKSQLDIRTDLSGELINILQNYPPSEVTYLQIYKGHIGDPNAEFKLIWTGRIINFGISGVEVTLAGQPGTTKQQRPGVTRNYQYQCPLVLYGPLCRAAKVATPFVVVSESLQGVVTATPAGADPNDPGRFNGGSIEWTNAAGRLERRWITAVSRQDNGQHSFTTSGPVRTLTEGTAVSVFKGCDHNRDVCNDRFNNIENFGGFSWIPTQDPNGTTTPFV